MLSVSGDSVPPVSAEELPSVPPVPHRAGSPWTVEDTEVLLDGVRRGLDPDEMATSLQRKTSAVLARYKKMLTPEFEVRAPQDAAFLLRYALLVDPSFDAAHNLDRATGRQWTEERDRALADAWATHRPIAELAAAIAQSELSIANRLIRLGLAVDSVAVAERLGATPGGALDLRCRMMRDRAAATVWVLIVDGLPDGRHISLHATREDADTQITDLYIGDTPPETLTTTLAQRAVGAPYGPVETARGDFPSPHRSS